MDGNRDAKGLGHGAGLPVPARISRPLHPPAVPADRAAGYGFYKPSDQGLEGQVAERLARWRKAQAEALAGIREKKEK